MAVSSTLPTSRRKYLSQSELAQYADITINDTTEADDKISQAEEIIDSYVGYQRKFIEYDVDGLATAGGNQSITLDTQDQNIYYQDYFKWCQIEIIGGTGEGQRRTITASTKAGVLTVDTAWDTNPDNTSFYIINQLGKFPRVKDVRHYSSGSTNRYYKRIPEEVKRAVAYQVAYLIELGKEYFDGDQSDKQSESIGDYSYSKGNAKQSNGLKNLIAPKARQVLKYIMNRTGRII